ncbi:MAG: T9SS type A sorting domain-containing protein [candidate division Zixibacteria bacterium]|nr:T9SS type A sorting domain-containing protein [candidate division Zixibacteria bacterium]
MQLLLSALLTLHSLSAQDLGAADTLRCSNHERPIFAPDSFGVFIYAWSDDTLTAATLTLHYQTDHDIFVSASAGPLVENLEGSVFLVTHHLSQRAVTINWIGFEDHLVAPSGGVLATVYFRMTDLDFCRSGLVLDTCSLWLFESSRFHPLRGNSFVPRNDFPVFIRCVGVDDGSDNASERPAALRLTPPHPNPFNSAVSWQVDISEAEWVSVTIHDILGREVRELAATAFSAGSHSFEWDGTDNAGEQAATGVYFLRVTNATVSKTMKLLLLR